MIQAYGSVDKGDIYEYAKCVVVQYSSVYRQEGLF